MAQDRRIALIGGTGPLGRGLALRWASAGYDVAIGSRDVARAAALAKDLGHGITGDVNASVVQTADVCLLTVPWEAHQRTVLDLSASLSGKLVVDCVNPLGFDSHGPYALRVDEGSAAEQAAALLPESSVVAAFHHLSAVRLADESIMDLGQDVLVLGEDREDCERVIQLATALPGARGVFAGRLRNAGQVEALTANLIAINRRYQAHAGLRVTDV